MAKDLEKIRREVATMADGLFRVVGLPFESTSEVQRQVLAAFAFGMTFAVTQIERLSPPDAHTLVLQLLQDVYKYSDHQAAAFSQELINCTGKEGNPTTNAIIHRGIDGHAQWCDGRIDELKANLYEVLKAVES